jgi:hypothetical protein
MLDPPTRRILEAHYTPRSGWAPGVVAHLGVYASACMALTANRAKLELACCHGALTGNQIRIQRELGRAERAVRAAHRSWTEKKRENMIAWIRE